MLRPCFTGVSVWNPPVPPEPLPLIFEAVSTLDIFDNLGFAPSDVNGWNTYFAGFYTTPFTSVVVDGLVVSVYGATGVIIPASMWLNEVGIKRMTDLANCVIEIQGSAFQNTTGMTSVQAESCVTLGDFAFSDSFVAGAINMPLCTSMGVDCFRNTKITSAMFNTVAAVPDNAFRECFFITSMNFDAAVTVGAYSFYRLLAFTGTLSFPSMTDAGANAFAFDAATGLSADLLENIGASCFADTQIALFVLPALLTGGDNCMANNSQVTSVTLAACTSLNQNSIEQCPLLETVSAPQLLSCGLRCFNNDPSMTLINIPLCADLGGSPLDNEVFRLILGNTITLNCPASLATNNAGNPDGDIQFLIANNTATVNYI